MNKKVVITGTNGFIGSNLREELKSKYQIVEINEDLLDLPDWTEKINIFLRRIFLLYSTLELAQTP